MASLTVACAEEQPSEDGTESGTAASDSDVYSGRDLVIGVSQPFMTNSWQQAVGTSAEWAADQFRSKGRNVELQIVDAGGNPQTQIQQINDLVLSGVDVLLVNPTSASALNGAIEDAIAQGTPTLTFADGPTTSDAPYDLEMNFGWAYGELARQTFDLIGGKGNVLNIRGTAGAGADDDVQNHLEQVFAEYPEIDVVAEVYGEWDESTTQSRVAAILPTLPEIDAIITQGQEGYGAAQAFLAAGREVPFQIWGLVGCELKMLKELTDAGGYDSYASTTDAGIGSVAVNMAVALADGLEVQKYNVLPLLVIEPDGLDEWANLGDNDTAYQNHSYEWTVENIINGGEHELK
jgi:ribose transport system substrate-binding protein